MAATALAWLPMLAWFAAFRPGIMTGDSLEIWRQATTEATWIDLHPPIYTAAMWLSHTLVGSPSALTLGQSLLLAAGFVAVGRSLIRSGVERRLAVAVVAVVVCTPQVGAFSVSLWKDIPFTAALLFVAARLLDVAAGRIRGHLDGERRALASLAAWGLLAVLARQNGILVVGPVLVVLVLVLKGVRKPVVLALVATLGVLGVVKAVVYPLLDIAPPPPHASVSTLLHDLASVAAHDPRAFDAGDRAVLEVVAPFETWRAAWQRFDCHSANWQFDPAFGWANIERHQSAFTRLWLEELRDHPRAVLGNRLCAGAVAWRPDNHGPLYTVSRGVDANDYGLRTVPLVDGLHDAAVRVIGRLDRGDVQWFAWRAPGWLYLTYAVLGAVAWRRRTWWLLLPLSVPVALQAAVTAFNPAQDARYLLPGLVLAWLLLPLAVARADAT